MIDARNLRKWFGPKLAVNDVSFTVERAKNDAAFNAQMAERKAKAVTPASVEEGGMGPGAESPVDAK